MKIIVPFDFSKSSEMALFYAVFHQKSFNNRMMVLHAMTTPFVFPNEYQPLFDSVEEIEDIKKRLDNAVLDFIELQHVDSSLIKIEVQRGDASQIILQNIDSKNFDMIIMGTHEKEGFMEKLLGSVSNTILKETELPILFIHSSSKKIDKIKKVLFAIDSVTDLHPALEWFNKYNKYFNASVDFIHFKVNEKNVEGQLDSLLSKLYFDNNVSFVFNVEIIETKNPIDTMADLMIERNYDMLVVVKGKSNFINSFFKKSFSKTAAHRIEMPILVLNSLTI